MNLRDLSNIFFAQFPVIGPHYNIEPQLLLAGKKPLGWESVVPPLVDENHPDIRWRIDMQRQLDAAVASGRLKAVDVVTCDVIKPSPQMEKEFAGRMLLDREGVFRHYCQPGNEKNLKLMSTFNQASFNRQKVEVKLEKDMGDYLGYRKRDQALWNWTGRNRLPSRAQEALVWFNVHVAQPALRAELLRRAKKALDKLPAPATGDYLDECRRKAEAGDTHMQVELGTMHWWRREYAETERYLRMAANSGNPIAQHDLGVLYVNGEGVQKNNAEAYFWMKLATTSKLNFYTEDNGLKAIAVQLTDDQRADVEKRLAAWKPAALPAAAVRAALPKPEA